MTSVRARQRVRHHALIALSAVAAGALARVLFGPAPFREGLSIGLAYASLALLAFSLALGPLNVLRGRANPLSSDLRRDVGIWAGVTALAHTAVGLTVHMRGRMQLYFLPPDDARGALPIRLDAFGLANHLGLLCALVLVVLMALSNDRALRALGAARWKSLQRLNYLCIGALVGHGVLYQLLERRGLALAAGFVALIGITLTLQVSGWRAYRRAARAQSRGSAAQL